MANNIEATGPASGGGYNFGGRWAPGYAMSDKADFYVLYRWRLKTGMEQQFTDAWAKMTELIRAQRGGLGSRLHYRDDGWWVAYAAWPSRDQWMISRDLGPADMTLAKLMNDAIAERQPAEELLPVRDLVAGK